MDLSAEREANNLRRAELARVVGSKPSGVQERTPGADFVEMPKVIAIMSVPRLGFMDNFGCAISVLPKFGIPLRTVTGAFWGQCLERAMTDALKTGADWVLTIDYDSVYTEEQLEHLLALAASRPEVDAIAPIQIGRSLNLPLFTIKGEDGVVMGEMTREHFNTELVKAATAHFGLTLIRASKVAKMPHPWFKGVPNDDGLWDDGRQDDDVYFWKEWEKAGHSLYVAPRVAIGHLELMIRWPNINFEVMHQHPIEFKSGGLPAHVWK